MIFATWASSSVALQVGSKGSATIEASVITIAWCALLISALAAVSAAYIKTWSHFVLYETLICLAEQQSKTLCEESARATTKTYIPYARGIRINTFSTMYAYGGDLRVSDGFSSQEVKTNLQLQTPTRIVK